MHFFNKLPSMYYTGQQAKNLLARAKLSNSTKENRSLYYKYTITDVDGRADNISQHYYDNPDYAWLIYLANEVVDPYYDMGLQQEDFDKYIVKKYGSLEAAITKIAFYRTNWQLLEDSEISVGNYDALEPEEKKYWAPNYNVYGQINGYQRKQEDVIVSTNRIIQMEVADTQGEFTVGERIQANTSTYGFVTFANSSVISMQHIAMANTSNILGVTLTGRDSGATANVQTAVIVAEPITSGIEAKYWEPVSYYDNENEINTLKRNITLIDNRYKTNIETDLARLMR